MEKLLKKLHSQRGETMLMALLLFLVGVMVSAVILAAAISAASDAKAAREEQQAYLTVSSAAELFRDAMESGSGGYREIEMELYYKNQWMKWQELEKQSVQNWSNFLTQKQEATGNFSEIMNSVAVAMFNNSPSIIRTYTLSLSGMEDVTMELIARPLQQNNKQYEFTVRFYNDIDGDHPCLMIVTFSGEVNSAGNGNGNTTEIVDKNGNTFEVPVYSVTTQIRWSNFLISRPGFNEED